MAPIVLITIDTLRADHLGSYGYQREVSPNLDRFARGALLFENTFAAIATTLPSHVSLFTSTLTTTHGIKGNYSHMKQGFREERGIRTLAEMLHEIGYRTAAFVSAAPLKDHTGIQAGFEVFDQPQDRERRAAETTRAVLDWLHSRPPGPLFLWVHYWDPHAPYSPPPEYEDAFQADQALLEFLDARRYPSVDDRVLRWNNRYDGEVLYLDAQIQRLFDALGAADLWDPGAVVVTSDHGEGLGQHDWRDHGRIYNEQLHVPLIIKLPADVGAAPGRVATLASLIDVVPTLVQALDLPVGEQAAAQLEGIDLLSAAPSEREFVFAERSHRDRDWEGGLKYALISEEWKLLHSTEAEDELYDMVANRAETENLIDRHQRVAARMLAWVFEILADEVPYEAGDLPPDRVRELRALGYIR